MFQMGWFNHQLDFNHLKSLDLFFFVFVYGFYRGKSPLNQDLEDFVSYFFPSIKQANPRICGLCLGSSQLASG